VESLAKRTAMNPIHRSLLLSASIKARVAMLRFDLEFPQLGVELREIAQAIEAVLRDDAHAQHSTTSTR
jgi:hypothetical protein